MPIFTALRNQAGQIAAGLAGRAIKSALGIGDVGGAFGPAGGTGLRASRLPSETMQYPLDLSHESNSHFVMFTCMQFKGKSKVDVGTKQTLSDDGGAAADFEGIAAGATPSDQERIRQTKDLLSLAQGRGSGSLQSTSRPSNKSGPYIALYMPPSVQGAYSLRYNDVEIGTEANVLHAAYQSFKNTSNVTEAFQDLANSNVAAIDGVKDLFNKKMIKVADAFLTGSAAAIGIERGVIFTPKMELMFEGVNRRSFSYSFIMMPTSVQEAEEIKRIIHTFKSNAAPNYADDLGMQMTIPHRWKIEYFNTGPGNDGSPAVNGYLTDIRECFLETINIVYGGDKYIAHETTKDGAPPARVQMTLNFRELEIITKDIINNKSPLPGDGVGASGGIPKSVDAAAITGGDGGPF